MVRLSLAAGLASLATSTLSIALADIDHLFAFGDSYTTDGWSPSRGIDPVKNQELKTFTGGENWFQFLAATTGANQTYYDLAVSGATTDNALVNRGSINSFVQQVQTFEQYFASTNSTVQWRPNTTLFCVFVGINDVLWSYTKNESYPLLEKKIQSSYNIQIGKLYTAGARKFLLLNIPPIDKTPQVQGYGASVAASFKSNAATWNANLASYALRFPIQFPGSAAVVYDTNKLLSSAIASPAKYGFDARFVNTFCLAYANVYNKPNDNLGNCTVPLAKYIYWNGFHVSWAVQQLFARGVENTLETF